MREVTEREAWRVPPSRNGAGAVPKRDGLRLRKALLVVNSRHAIPQGGQLLITTERVSLDSHQALNHAEGRAGEFGRPEGHATSKCAIVSHDHLC
jgi:hypothetical protein